MDAFALLTGAYQPALIAFALLCMLVLIQDFLAGLWGLGKMAGGSLTLTYVAAWAANFVLALVAIWALL